MEGRKEEQKAEYPKAARNGAKAKGIGVEERGSDGKPERKAKKKTEAERWKLEKGEPR